MTSFKVTKQFSIKPDADATDSKKWNLELTIPEGTTMQDLARAVLASEVVKVQNGNRSKFDKYPNGHTFKKTFAKPGIDEDPITAIVNAAKAEGITVEEYMKREIAKR